MASNSASIKRASANDRAAAWERAHAVQAFTTPSDLECPITHDLFVDPVINAVGQVYERHAITSFLQYHDTDPVTREVLPNKTLTPVYVLRSRAIEYRENSARACIEAACSPACDQPALYLRRAAELCSVLPAPIQGLSSEALQYIQAHPSNAYDERSLQLFAEGLFQAGYRDKAASIYYSLLQAGADRAQQGELLRKCLECWQAGSDGDGGIADSRTFTKLAEFVSTQRTFTWSQIIDVAAEAQLGDVFTLRLCEQLLSSNSADGPYDESLAILMKYVQVLNARTQSRLDALEQQQQQSSRRARPPAGGDASSGGSSSQPRPKWLNNRAVASAALLATTVAQGYNPWLQFARVASLLCVLRQN